MISWQHPSTPGDLEPTAGHVYCQNGLVIYPGEVCIVVAVMNHGLDMQKAWFMGRRGQLGWLYQQRRRAQDDR